MFSTSSSNIHHYVKTFKVDGTVQNTKNGTSQEQIIFDVYETYAIEMLQDLIRKELQI